MTNYSTQLDEIDKWLFDSFGIVAGACSSTENLRYNTARTIAEVLWPKEQDFTHHETNESLQEAVTHQMEDEQVIDDYVRRGLDDIVLKYAQLGAKWQREQLRDLCYQCEKNYDNVFYKGEQHAIKMLKEEAIEVSCFGGKEGEEHIVTFVVPCFKIKNYYKLGDTAKIYIFIDNKK